MRLYWVTTNCIKNNARFTIKQEREQTPKSVLFLKINIIVKLY